MPPATDPAPRGAPVGRRSTRRGSRPVGRYRACSRGRALRDEWPWKASRRIAASVAATASFDPVTASTLAERLEPRLTTHWGRIGMRGRRCARARGSGSGAVTETSRSSMSVSSTGSARNARQGRRRPPDLRVSNPASHAQAIQDRELRMCQLHNGRSRGFQKA